MKAFVLCSVLAMSAACNSADPTSSARESASADVEELAKKARQLEQAELDVARSPTDEDKLIWLGRRLAYLERYDEAQGVFTRGLELHTDSWKLLRHRGHRWITLRKFDRAIEDLQRAWELCRRLPDEIEPDGQPNAAGIPIGSYHSNIVYHLALAHYLRGEWLAAAEVWEQGRASSSQNGDRLCSSTYWNHLALRRAGLETRAQQMLERVVEPLVILENESYRQLCRLFQGMTTGEEALRNIEPGTVEFATRAYGVACWNLLRGEEREAHALFRRIADTGPRNAFGCIAAEMELQ
jgi:tetratricopeptide (TPR) repeat protein